MRRVLHIVTSVVMSGLICIVIAVPTSAEEPIYRVAPSDTCRTDPLDGDRLELVAEVFDYEAREASPRPEPVVIYGTPVPIVIESDQALDDPTFDTVVDLAEEWAACWRKSDDPLRFLALHTDEYLLAYVESMRPSTPRYVNPERPLEGHNPGIPDVPVLEIHRVTTLPDGRVAMELDMFSAGHQDREDQQIPVLLIFERVDGVRLVDGEQIGDRPYVGDEIEPED